MPSGRYACNRCNLRTEIAWTADRGYQPDLACTNRPWRHQPDRRCTGTLQPYTPCQSCYPKGTGSDLSVVP